MNIATPQPRAFEPGPPDLPQNTAMSGAFSMLLPIFEEYSSAERDLEDIGYSWDTPYTNWHKDSERAQDRLIDVLRDLRTLPVTIPEDLPLRRIALYLHVMRASDAEVARRVHQRLEAGFDQRFILPGISATARHRNVLLHWVRPIVASFAALPLFAPHSEEGGDPDDEAPTNDPSG